MLEPSLLVSVVGQGESGIASKGQGERHMEQGLLRFVLTSPFCSFMMGIFMVLREAALMLSRWVCRDQLASE